MSGFKRRARDRTTGVQTNRRPPWGPIPAAMGVVQVLWPARESSVPLTLTVLPQEASACCYSIGYIGTREDISLKEEQRGALQAFLDGESLNEFSVIWLVEAQKHTDGSSNHLPSLWKLPPFFPTVFLSETVPFQMALCNKPYGTSSLLFETAPITLMLYIKVKHCLCCFWSAAMDAFKVVQIQ